MGQIILAVAVMVILLPLGWFGWENLHFLAAAQWAAVLEEHGANVPLIGVSAQDGLPGQGYFGRRDYPCTLHGRGKGY